MMGADAVQLEHQMAMAAAAHAEAEQHYHHQQAEMHMEAVMDPEEAERERVKRQYRGVFWDKKTKRWRCQLGYQSKKIFLGYYEDPADAARAYDQKLVELRGAAARTNFPINEYYDILNQQTTMAQRRRDDMGMGAHGGYDAAYDPEAERMHGRRSHDGGAAARHAQWAAAGYGAYGSHLDMYGRTAWDGRGIDAAQLAAQGWDEAQIAAWQAQARAYDASQYGQYAAGMGQHEWQQQYADYYAQYGQQAAGGNGYGAHMAGRRGYEEGAYDEATAQQYAAAAAAHQAAQAQADAAAAAQKQEQELDEDYENDPEVAYLSNARQRKRGDRGAAPGGEGEGDGDQQQRYGVKRAREDGGEEAADMAAAAAEANAEAQMAAEQAAAAAMMQGGDMAAYHAAYAAQMGGGDPSYAMMGAAAAAAMSGMGGGGLGPKRASSGGGGRPHTAYRTKYKSSVDGEPEDGRAHTYRGVFWDKKSKRWRCQLGHKNKKIFLGYYNDPEEAARAYDVKLVELNGAAAKTNFPIVDYLDQHHAVSSMGGRSSGRASGGMSLAELSAGRGYTQADYEAMARGQWTADMYAAAQMDPAAAAAAAAAAGMDDQGAAKRRRASDLAGAGGDMAAYEQQMAAYRTASGQGYDAAALAAAGYADPRAGLHRSMSLEGSGGHRVVETPGVNAAAAAAAAGLPPRPGSGRVSPSQQDAVYAAAAGGRGLARMASGEMNAVAALSGLHHADGTPAAAGVGGYEGAAAGDWSQAGAASAALAAQGYDQRVAAMYNHTYEQYRGAYGDQVAAQYAEQAAAAAAQQWAQAEAAAAAGGAQEGAPNGAQQSPAGGGGGMARMGSSEVRAAQALSGLQGGAEGAYGQPSPGVWQQKAGEAGAAQGMDAATAAAWSQAGYGGAGAAMAQELLKQYEQAGGGGQDAERIQASMQALQGMQNAVYQDAAAGWGHLPPVAPLSMGGGGEQGAGAMAAAGGEGEQGAAGYGYAAAGGAEAGGYGEAVAVGGGEGGQESAVHGTGGASDRDARLDALSALLGGDLGAAAGAAAAGTEDAGGAAAVEELQQQQQQQQEEQPVQAGYEGEQAGYQAEGAAAAGDYGAAAAEATAAAEAVAVTEAAPEAQQQEAGAA